MKPYWKSYGGPGFDLLERTAQTITERDMLQPGDTVVAAVSGGPDSTCLLDVLARLGEKLDLAIVVAHVDHGLSDASKDIAARASASAAKAGFEVHLARAPDLEGPNLHARARDFRYEFLDIVATRETARRIATGHTLDDRVETTLGRLVHGAGTEGLAGLPPVEGTRIRPLIESRRAETRAYCDEVGLEYFDDPANQDERFERTSVRSRLMTAIEERWGDGAIRAIARSTERLREDSDALTTLAATIYSDTVVGDEGGNASFDLVAMVLLPRALQRRVLEQAIGRVRDRAAGITQALDALESHARGTGVRGRFAVAGGIEIVLTDKTVQVVRVVA